MQADAIGLKRNFRLGMDRLKAAHKNVRFPSDSDRTASRIGSFVPITEVGRPNRRVRFTPMNGDSRPQMLWKSPGCARKIASDIPDYG